MASRGQHFVFVPQNTIGGIELVRDLRLLTATPRPLCLDIGANEGQTIDMLSVAWPNATIHAFEPSSTVFSQLRARYHDNNIVLHNVAVGCLAEKREFINYAKSDLSSFLELARRPGSRFGGVRETSRETVDVVTVDEFLVRHSVDNVSLLKTDTQGFDLEVLEGASESLERGLIQNVLVELNFVPLYHGQANAQQITDKLARHGLYLVDYYEKIRQRNTLAWCSALFHKSQQT